VEEMSAMAATGADGNNKDDSSNAGDSGGGGGGVLKNWQTYQEKKQGEVGKVPHVSRNYMGDSHC
jgi:hypothetical protein